MRPLGPRQGLVRALPGLPALHTVLLLAAAVAALLRGACAGEMGEQCDWNGSGVSTAGRGVTPVYLRCSAGALSWRWPRGALRVLLRVGAAGRDFRACVRTRGSGARLFLEGPRSLAPLYPGGPGGRARRQLDGDVEGQLVAPVPVRCFYSRHGQAALYVEASELGAPGVGEPHEEFGLEYDLELLPRGAKFDDSQDCRPCTSDEMARAYCTSDLVARGYIRTVENDEDLEESRVNVKLTRVLRRLAEAGVEGAGPGLGPGPDAASNGLDEDEAVWVHGDESATLRMPLHCGAKPGPGEYVFMARRKLSQLALTCAASLDNWVQVVSDVNAQGSAHCVLRS
ncbi:meteorin-like protein [Thrips palmi]|uniref:Meteorin-like protein n=1 Tax=Thrips palmi TaxID=161013 RepID=A0A6P8ZTT0_THRPL|nr:meteorin-like protein [Thrips palmi]